jgi:hypothetical protein
MYRHLSYVVLLLLAFVASNKATAEVCPKGVVACISGSPYPPYGDPNITPTFDEKDPLFIPGLNIVEKQVVTFSGSDKKFIYIGKDQDRHNKFVNVLNQRIKKETELWRYRTETKDIFQTPLQDSIDTFTNNAKQGTPKGDIDQHTERHNQTKDSVDASNKECNDFDRFFTERVKKAPVPPRPPTVKDNNVNPSHHSNHTVFKTPQSNPGYQKLIAADRLHRAAKPYVFTAPPQPEFRQALYTVSGKMIHIADANFFANDPVLGNLYADLATEMAAQALNYAPKHSIGMFRAGNFITGVLEGLLGLPIGARTTNPNDPIVTAEYQEAYYNGVAMGSFIGIGADHASTAAGIIFASKGRRITPEGVIVGSTAMEEALENIKASKRNGIPTKRFKEVVTKRTWSLSDTDRGNFVEHFLAYSEYKDWFWIGKLDKGKFPLVDFQKGNVLVSLKTVNTKGSTWLQRMEDHIIDLGTRGATVDGRPARMVLDLRVQPGGGVKAVKSLKTVAEEYKVKLKVKEFWK